MFNNEELIKDDNKIRPCSFNYARMNIFEYMYCKIFIWKTISRNIKESFIEMIENFKDFIIHLLDLCLIPISFLFIFPIVCYRDIEKAKKEVFENSCFKCKFFNGSPFKNNNNNKGIGICESCKLVNGKALNFQELKLNKGE